MQGARRGEVLQRRGGGEVEERWRRGGGQEGRGEGQRGKKEGEMQQQEEQTERVGDVRQCREQCGEGAAVR